MDFIGFLIIYVVLYIEVMQGVFPNHVNSDLKSRELAAAILSG